MLLSNGEIRDAIASGELEIAGYDPGSGSLQPASIDLHLDAMLQLQSAAPISGVTIDTEAVDITDHIARYSEKADISNGWRFAPGRFVIGQTVEIVKLPLHLSGRVEGRSRLARLGVGVHITAPKIDPGFHNHITLEIFNLGPWTIELKGGMTICTLLVERLGKPAESGYAGIFQGSAGNGTPDPG